MISLVVGPLRSTSPSGKPDIMDFQEALIWLKYCFKYVMKNIQIEYT